jgi:two-component system, chemotaxis family, chemotaxis protein CheY
MAVIDGAKRVMVVHFRENIRKILSLVLMSNGFHVIETVNGKEALEQLDGSKIDMLITDLNLPQMNGIELVKNLRSRSAFKSMPVIMVSSDNLESKVRRAKQMGVNEWLLTPLIPSVLMVIVRRLINEKNSLISPIEGIAGT